MNYSQTFVVIGSVGFITTSSLSSFYLSVAGGEGSQIRHYAC